MSDPRPISFSAWKALALLLSIGFAAPSASAQKKIDPKTLTPDEIIVRIKPAELTLAVGENAKLEYEVVDIGGRPVDARAFFFSSNRRKLRVRTNGEVSARTPGKYTVTARVPLNGRMGPQAQITVTVPFPKPAKVSFQNAPSRLWVGERTRLPAAVLDTKGAPRPDLDPAVHVSNPKLARVDAFGVFEGLAPGTVKLTAKHGALEASHTIEVIANPVRRITMSASANDVRTGDVVRVTTTCFDANDATVVGAPVHFSVETRPDNTRGVGAAAQVAADGRFVAEEPGLYTVIASCGKAIARTTIRAKARNLRKRCQLVGRGKVQDVHTSDLWVWEGVDGRDYCVTGTWGANGEAIFWDVTNPKRIERISTVKVDARTVNDVKVSKDGKLCILSREGASNRKNGIVILNVENPREPKILSTFTENLTGGVHNLYIFRKHVYALSAGRRYDIINIEDPAVPKRVGSYQIFKPGASIHDVWVEKGIAYSSNWRYGVHMVDVGNGIKGGTPEKPVKIGSYAYPSGWNHAAFPYHQKSTGKFYVLAGDEAFPFGLNLTKKPTYPRGWIHVIDFTNTDKPKEVASYKVPEAGTHNLWIEDDLLYVAYYNGGLRVVDISGELMGDLYAQGREIAWFLPTDDEGVVPNAPMAWGPQPHKGHIFFSDWNSGLWCVKLVEDPRGIR